MIQHLDIDDPKYRKAATQILLRHDNFEAEANIVDAVRDFLVITGLVRAEDLVAENPPSSGSRRAVDLTALDTFIEFKRRIGTISGGQPSPENVSQLDEYLAESERAGRVRMGVLTDGKYWLLRWPGAGAVKLTKPYFFTLKSAEQWFPLYEWLRNNALESVDNVEPVRQAITEHFGLSSPSYQRDIGRLKALYLDNAHLDTLRVKRQLWQDLLRTALGEIARSGPDMDDLFVRHTYLSAVIGMVVQSSFDLDIKQLAAIDPQDLLYGRRFHNDTGLRGIVESDFFAWPAEVGGNPLLQTLARRVAKFQWKDAPSDVAAILYETVIPPDERRQLGEYYTPDWLARTMVKELIDKPLEQRTLDPACGSGTFIGEAVTHFIEAARKTSWEPKEVLDKLRDAVTGIDVHPVAVHLARAAWTLAARPAISAAGETGYGDSLSIPVYLGDSLQLRFRTGDLFAEQEIIIQALDEDNTQLVFPVSLVDRPENFDALMSDIADYIERGGDPFLALDDNHVTDPGERKTIVATINAMRTLHEKGRDHIWAYYTRNMVRPVALSRRKVDVLIGNPPWLNYRNTYDVLRAELRNLSRNRYDVWAGGRYATHQDVAGLFFTRSVDLYLKDEGVIGFVMPHSALGTGQYGKWRTGRWRAGSAGLSVHVDFDFKSAWDLEQLEPNTFFPVPASVIFASKCRPDTPGKALSGPAECWQGEVGTDDVTREVRDVVAVGETRESPYADHARQGASIVPRCLFFVNEAENPALLRAAQTITVNPRRGSNDKRPWRDLSLTGITNQTIELAHLYDVHLGETLAPYVTLTPLRVLLPVRKGGVELPTDDNGPGGIRLSGLERRMRDRWETVSGLWENNKAATNRLNLSGQLDYLRKLSSQLEWQHDQGRRPIRIVYSASGEPTAALLEDSRALVESNTYWVTCRSRAEAHYLLAIINSDALYDAVKPLMAKGQFGARHLQKQLWRLPIPEYDRQNGLHGRIARAGARAAAAASGRLEQLRQERGEGLTVTIIRRELRQWLRTSRQGNTVEAAVEELLRS